MSELLITELREGLRFQQAGRMDEAETRYRRALDRCPNHPDALNLLAALCVNSARPEEAVRLISAALALRPDDPQAHANLGLALKELGRFAEAAESFSRSLRLQPRNAVVHNNLGNVYRALSRHAEAVRCYEQALQLNPAYFECWSNLAALGCEMGRHERALQAVDRALTINPGFAEAHKVRGDILRKLSRFDEAVQSYEKAIALRPDFHEAMIDLAAAQSSRGEVAAAEAMLRRVISADSRNALALHGLGVLKEQLGELEEASAALAKAVSIAPQLTLSHYQLAQLRGRHTTDEELRLRMDLYSQQDLLPEQRVQLAFALAIGFEERGDYERAFGFLRDGNRIKAERFPYDDDEARAYTRRIMDAFRQMSPGVEPPPGATELRPVFVLGMPRSGTSLTEQLLASHPAVTGAGELSCMEDTANLSRKMTGAEFPESCTRLSIAQCAELRGYYLSRLARVAEGHRYVVDKTPMNFQYIGLISAILPDARIVHCRRSPIDVCLSIYQRPFEDSHTYAHELQALGQYYGHYRRLMEFWKIHMADRILDVCYEDTVADVEQQSRRMLDFLGLDFDRALLEFHTTRRLVRTPSASQVRQPIYKDSVDSWRRFEPYLGPLLTVLQVDSSGQPGCR